MSFSNTHLPKPKNWQDFEREILILFKYELNDPTIQQNGRSGQGQNGVDIIGNREGKWVGIQCKEKFENAVTENELRKEVEKAKKFKPKLDEFFLVTTAPRDQRIQKTARIITDELKKYEHPFKVTVWGWDDIEDSAQLYEKVWKYFDPTYTPFTDKILNDIQLYGEDSKNRLDNLTESVQQLTTSVDIVKTNNDSKNNSVLSGKIDVLQESIDNGHPDIALDQLLSLKQKEWKSADSRDRYSIDVALACAHLKLGNSKQAGELLIEACNEDPYNKNAIYNKATGFLLISDYSSAIDFCRETLTNIIDAQIAGILVQALAHDPYCKNPLEEIPEVIKDTEDVIISYIYFQRAKDNQEWMETAKDAYKRYPDKKLIKLAYADSILEYITKNNNSLVGGNFNFINYSEFHNIVEFLYSEACHAIESYSELQSVIVHNAALALRIENDNKRAKEILDKVIKHCPYDENIRLQRAAIAHEENDPNLVLSLLEGDVSELDSKMLKIDAFIDNREFDKALKLMDNVKKIELSINAKMHLLESEVYISIVKGDNLSTIIEEIENKLKNEPLSTYLHILRIKLLRLTGSIKDNIDKEFDYTFNLVIQEINLQQRLRLSFEAEHLKKYKEIVELLNGNIEIQRDSFALRMLITASINGGFFATANSIFNNLPQRLRVQEWYQKAKLNFLFNIGSKDAEEYLNQYLKQYPNDLNIIMMQISLLLKDDKNIVPLLEKIDIEKLKGQPIEHINLAAIICKYGDVSTGLKYAYKVLMNNWNNADVHNMYHVIIIMNPNPLENFMIADTADVNTVICIKKGTNEHRYRIEKDKYIYFEEERIDIEDPLSKLVVGKKIGDQIILPSDSNDIYGEIIWIKSIYLDIFHKSLETFTERFPNQNTLRRLNINLNSENPFKEIEKIQRNRNESINKSLQFYQTELLPFAFLAKLTGADPIDTWLHFQEKSLKLKVCQGTIIERREAFNEIANSNKKGCILDSITLYLVKILEVKELVELVCGPIYITQSIINTFYERCNKASQNVDLVMGYVFMENDQMGYQEYSDEYKKDVLRLQKELFDWVKTVTKVAAAVPKKDLSSEVKAIADIYGYELCDFAIAAEGNDLLLITDDMGMRIWAANAFEIHTTWLQPILSIAYNKGYISEAKYYETINKLVFWGHTYVSLDCNCLMHQLRKDNFFVSRELKMLLYMLSGPSADLINNTKVLNSFIELMLYECKDESKMNKIIIEIFNTFIIQRNEDYLSIMILILKKYIYNKNIYRICIDWLIGHSFGKSYFNDLLIEKSRISF